MSIFSGLFKSRDHPKDITIGSSYHFSWEAARPVSP